MTHFVYGNWGLHSYISLNPVSPTMWALGLNVHSSDMTECYSPWCATWPAPWKYFNMAILLVALSLVETSLVLYSSNLFLLWAFAIVQINIIIKHKVQYSITSHYIVFLWMFISEISRIIIIFRQGLLNLGFVPQASSTLALCY